MEKMVFCFDANVSGKRCMAEEFGIACAKISMKEPIISYTPDMNFLKLIKLYHFNPVMIQSFVEQFVGARGIPFKPIFEPCTKRFFCIGIMDNKYIKDLDVSMSATSISW